MSFTRYVQFGQNKNELNKKNLTYVQRVRRAPPVEPTQIAGYVFRIRCFYLVFFLGSYIPFYNVLVCFKI